MSNDIRVTLARRGASRVAELLDEQAPSIPGDVVLFGSPDVTLDTAFKTDEGIDQEVVMCRDVRRSGRIGERLVRERLDHADAR